MKDRTALEADLSNFTGTETWWRHGLNKEFLYTDGVQYFAENAGGGAYWFLDIVATELFQLQKQTPFQHIQMLVSGQRAEIIADDGDGHVIWRREIEYTDCPEGMWEFYLTDNVLLLVSEY